MSVATLAAAIVLALGTAASAAVPARRSHTAATRIANLSPTQCRAELVRRRIETKPATGSYPGVAVPLRLSAPLQGVRFRTPGRRSVYGVLDCRLVLALDDFARLLVEAEVVEVQVDNFYRPHAHLPGRDKPSQHAYGLAADIDGFTLRSGKTLVVERDWIAAPGEPPCDGAPAEANEPAVLRKLVCSALDRGLFHHVLTPNSDAAHKNHLHFDLARSRNRGAKPASRKKR